MNTLQYNGETNPISPGYHREVTHEITRIVPWTTPGLYVIRLRLLTDPGFPAWDVSYCHGRIDDEYVDVEMPFSQLPKRGYRRAIVQHAIRAGVNAKSIGLLDNISTLT